MAETWPIALTERAKIRIRQIAAEQSTSAYEVIRTFAEEGALAYFRERNDDPARRGPIGLD